MKNNRKKLPAEEQAQLLDVLKNRFEKNMNRHENLEWAKQRIKLRK